MALFANNKTRTKTAKVKSKTKAKPRTKMRPSRFSNEGVETVVEVKTVGDIPPVLEARKLLGDENINGAAQTLYKAARGDYVRYFSAKGDVTGGNRDFFITELATFNVKVPEIGLVDNYTITEAINGLKPEADEMMNRVNTLKKLSSFYLNYYEKARYSNDHQFDGEELVSKFSEIYNYMDIMKLYFSRNMEV